MFFDSELFKRKAKCFRRRWNERHYVTYDKERSLFMENCGDNTHIWYWDDANDYHRAVTDLTADDWEYV